MDWWKIYVVLFDVFVLEINLNKGVEEREAKANETDFNLLINEQNMVCEAHINILEERLKSFDQEIMELKKQNNRLNSYIELISKRCFCHPHCTFNNTLYADNDVWYPHSCQICQCKAGHVKCENLLMPGCKDLCSPNPCKNNGICQLKPDFTDYMCRCPSDYKGRVCHIYKNFCIHSLRYGNCTDNRVMWHFNKILQRCEEYIYSGCGASQNIFPTLTDCQNKCIYGVCCYRSFGLGSKDRTVKCSDKSLLSCQQLHHMPQYEVIVFYPGMTCFQETCFALKKGGCEINNIFYLQNSTFTLGCELCHCNEFGSVSCSCRKLTARKEIRDLTFKEFHHFRKAVSELYSSTNDIWEQFVDMHSSYLMHSYNGLYFLLWNRHFLKHVEKHIQNIDCDVAIPYFDFTTETGNISDAFIWQPNYFGGNGEGKDNCVTDHQFHIEKSDPSRPCIQRNFNPNIQIPNMIEMTIAVKNPDFIQFNLAMLKAVGYLHNFIGGNMATSAAPYDPVFYVIHAYIDMLFWRWEQIHQQNENLIDFDLNTIILPFGITMEAALHSKHTLCITYILPSIGHPCNYTDEHYFGPDGYDAEGFDRQGFDKDGYDRDGYNILGYNKFGHYDTRNVYIFNGYNKEGYNRAGYDRRGYNQYGFHKSGYNQECYDVRGYNCKGFDRYGLDYKGYDKYGINHNIKSDQTKDKKNENTFEDNCLNFDGLTSEGFDQYGFNIYKLDKDGCSFGNNGPFVLIQAHKIQEILYKQTPIFLLNIHRTCKNVQSSAGIWESKLWNDHMDILEVQPIKEAASVRSIWSKRFCFDADIFLSSCSCKNEQIAVCDNMNTLLTCNHYPDAYFTLSFCGKCETKWYSDSKLVNCSIPPDYCTPNPCQHGGVCVPSIWPTEPHLISCMCQPEYEGPFCEQPSSQTCYLPVDHGTSICGQKQKRWFFNLQTGECETFTYNGCFGNGNNFDSYYKCRVTCIIGACCWQEPLHPERKYGYNQENYDRYGFTISGYSNKGEKQTLEHSFGGIHGLYNYDGYDYEGYDRHGFNKFGIDRIGYDRHGYHSITHYNLTGYNSFGDYDGIIDYDEKGFNNEGYNRAGLNCYGYNQDGWNYYGLCTGWKYSCRSTSLRDCQQIEHEFPHLRRRIIKFSLGKKCEEISCKDQCGCNFLDKSYEFGQKFQLGCSLCECHRYGNIICSCTKLNIRKEIRELTSKELHRYHQAIKSLHILTGHSSRWQEFTTLYSQHISQSHGTTQFLPWHRFFLRLVEMELQRVDCNITIPYFDWTMDVGNLESSVIWQANYFGGDGDKEMGNCIRNHPFKDHYPSYWTPCLRRQFNNSIYLPDTINLQFIYNQDSYDNFRIHLEASSTLFHLFVGGHMATPESPYDPIFLSHYAFIDRLWDIWETSKKNVVPQYPSALRYIPMIPFGVSPDEVLLNEKQLCVKYLPLLSDTHCNYFETDKFIEQTEKNNFDKFEIDKEGYSKNGFDMLGWNREGFYKNKFNRDGFDIFGYDKNGYNRFGFNRNGCTNYGFCNDTFSQNEISNLFNEYGYNQLGFDRSGYDVFGFNKFGYDRNNCSFFYNGPFYPLFKKYVDEQIYHLTNKELLNIKRICPQVSSIPEWWLMILWFERNNQIDIIRDYEEMTMLQHPVDKFSDYEVTTAWLPPTPDKRFCLQLNYYSGCSLDMSVVNCEFTICLTASCSGYPDAYCQPYRCNICEARFYDKVTGRRVNCFDHKCLDESGHHIQQKWIHPSDPCQTCHCQEGIIRCDRIKCSVSCNHPILNSNECCPDCSNCQFNGEIYTENAVVKTEDVCVNCLCYKGNVECESVSCVPVTCYSPVTVFGECCPVCYDCTFYNQTYKDGEIFIPIEDPCLNCTCEKGRVNCEKLDHYCNPQCTHPIRIRNACCPVCDGCEYDRRNYRNGQKFVPPDRKECLLCECANGYIHCMKKYCPPVSCDNPVKLQNDCCKHCPENCIVNGIHHSEGEVWVDPENKCQQCRCLNTKINCQPEPCPVTLCSNPAAPYGECCPYCEHCEFTRHLYRNGQEFFHIDDPCQKCTCKNGTVSCNIIHCKPLLCQSPISLQNECCPTCPQSSKCYFNNEVYKPQDIFPDPENICQQCICMEGGEVVCYHFPCPVIQCPNPVHKMCCESCDGCSFANVSYPNYQTFTDPFDNCRVCYCENGYVTCQLKKCKQISCKSSVNVRGECCPICLDCHYNNEIIPNEVTFPDVENTCNECKCERGSVQCYPKICPVVFCKNPVLEDCCLTCNKGCFYNNEVISDGQMVFDTANICNECKCEKGSVICLPKHCATVSCKHPVLEGCCPTCDKGCVYNSKVLADGQTFPDIENICNECRCKKGSVSCYHKVCSPVLCTHPVVEECCSTCSKGCVYNNKVLTDEQTFPDNENSCNECKCEKGFISCYPKTCSPALCKHPIVEECCPTCSKGCFYFEKAYKNEVEFENPEDKCESCICKNGNVVCNPVKCKPVNCKRPVKSPGKCCPDCTGCLISEKYYEHGTIFTNPDEICEECICIETEYICQKKPCMHNCTHPSPYHCCPECESCMFENVIYSNGQEFNPNVCQSCICKNGNVQCVTEICPELTCTLRTKLLDECCETCKGCIYDGKEYADGESWISYNNPCLSCRCQGGIVTCAELRCLVPCNNPQPVPNECCPICPDCILNGKTYQSGETFTPNGNPCDICTCEAGHLQCISQQCPALVDCPEEAIRAPTRGSCCPTCAGFSTSCTRQHIGMLVHPSNDPCFTCECKDGFNWICFKETCPPLICPQQYLLHVESECCSHCEACVSNTDEEIHFPGEIWVKFLEPCSQCKCENGQEICEKISCPTIECLPNEILQRPIGQCCEICVTAESIMCSHGEQIYNDEEEWKPDVCSECKCKMGTVTCHRERCIPLNCSSDHIPSVDPGNCCPKCIPRPATCVAFGDPHYRTFDGAIVHFQGTCRYIMVADCLSGNFTIEVQNSDRGVDGVSWTESVTIRLSGIIIDLLKGPTVSLNNKNISLPHFERPQAYIEKAGSSVLINTNVGVKVLWNGDSYVEVSVSGTYQTHTCGLCGNFNSFPQDDMRLQSGQIVLSAAVFGNSWKTADNQSNCEEVEDFDPCNVGGYHARKIANSRCAILKGPLFAPCHQVIPPELYYISCVYDLCACSENDDCLCDILSTYSQECSHAGIILHWRSSTLCEITCAEEDGLMFDECGPACPRTCENKDVPIRILATQCFKPCVPGCQCTADKVLHNNSCIIPEDCP